ncbi:MAG: hypothetical protein ACRD3W_30370, partial [Terriglobales bacterium]
DSNRVIFHGCCYAGGFSALMGYRPDSNSLAGEWVVFLFMLGLAGIGMNAILGFLDEVCGL